MRHTELRTLLRPEETAAFLKDIEDLFVQDANSCAAAFDCATYGDLRAKLHEGVDGPFFRKAAHGLRAAAYAADHLGEAGVVVRNGLYIEISVGRYEYVACALEHLARAIGSGRLCRCPSAEVEQ